MIHTESIKYRQKALDAGANADGIRNDLSHFRRGELFVVIITSKAELPPSYWSPLLHQNLYGLCSQQVLLKHER